MTKVALVTGGSRGIGAAISIGLKNAGYTVAANYAGNDEAAAKFSAETGIGWVNYMLEACDHEWERRHLWTQGLVTRPSELFKRQISMNFWYERAGIELRHLIGMDNIMWESDFPHSTSTYPESRQFVERTLQGVPEKERNQLLYGNALRTYNLA